MTDTLCKGGLEILPTAILSDKLSLVASKGHIDKVQELLQSGAKFDTDQEGRTALHYAALNGYSDICQMLIAHGCGLDHQDVVGFTALHRACSQGHTEVCKVLMEAGCALDCQDEHGNTALHEAAWNGFSRTLEILIKFNCDVSIVNKSGFTALHLAAQNGHNESSRVLIYAGCSTDGKNNYGDTALHTAARYGHAGVTRIFISARCALNEQNKNGDTPLHIAAALKRRKITKLLVEAGIDPYIRNKQNETAVDVAQRKEYPEIVHLIATHSKRKSYCQPMVNVSMERPTVTFEGKKLPTPSETKPAKEKRFFFFKRKKKNKAIPSQPEVTSNIPVQTVRNTQRQIGKTQPVQGFFNKYVPKEGVQYYRDLAGNIKQGPIGYTPICQCIPVVKRLERNLDETCENIYEHIDASHQILQNRINQLDKRTAQQVSAIDRLTSERLSAHNKRQLQYDGRLHAEHKDTEHSYTKYNDNIKSELQAYVEDQSSDDESYHPHHHDDSGFYHRSVFFKVHENENGRLFRSRSDETLSQSDYSARHRKKDFYENRQAAMQHIRAWQTADRNWRREGCLYKDSQIKEASTGANRHRTTVQPGPCMQLQNKDQQMPFLKSPSSDYVSYSEFLKNPLSPNSAQGHQSSPRSWQPSYTSNAVEMSSIQNPTAMQKKCEKGQPVLPGIESHYSTIPRPVEKSSHFSERDPPKGSCPNDSALNPTTIYSAQNTTPRKYSDTPAILKADPSFNKKMSGISDYAITKPSQTQWTQPYKPSPPLHNSKLTKRDEGLVTGRSRSQDLLLESSSKEVLYEGKPTNYICEQTVSLGHSKSHNNISKDIISDNHPSLNTMHPKTSFIPYGHPIPKPIPNIESPPTPCSTNHAAYARYTPSTNTHASSCTAESNPNIFPKSVSPNPSRLYHRDNYQSILSSSQPVNYTPPYKNPPPYHSKRTLQGDIEENFNDQRDKSWSKASADSQGNMDNLLAIKSSNTNSNSPGCVLSGNYTPNNQVPQVTSPRLTGALGKTLKKDPLLLPTSTEKKNSNEKFSPHSIEHVHQADVSHCKEDSSSNPDSGYSSRIYGATNLDASNRSSSTLLNSVHSSLTTPSSFSGTDQSFCASPANLSPYHNQSEYSNRVAVEYETQTASNKQYFESVTAHLQNWYHKKKQESLQKDNLHKKSLISGLPPQQQQQQQKLLPSPLGINLYSAGSKNQGHNYIRGSDV